MSQNANSNSKTPPATGSPEQTPPVQQDSSEAGSPLSSEQIDARIAEGVAKGIADFQQSQAVGTPEAKPAEKPRGKTSWPFGNLDTKKEFDLSKLTGWGELPTDKVIVVHPRFNTDSKGKKIGYDLDSCLIQPIDPEKHRIDSTPAKVGGYTTYGLLGMDPLVLHDPSK